MYMSTEYRVGIWQSIDHLHNIQYLNIRCRRCKPQNNWITKCLKTCLNLPNGRGGKQIEAFVSEDAWPWHWLLARGIFYFTYPVCLFSCVLIKNHKLVSNYIIWDKTQELIEEHKVQQLNLNSNKKLDQLGKVRFKFLSTDNAATSDDEEIADDMGSMKIVLWTIKFRRIKKYDHTVTTIMIQCMPIILMTHQSFSAILSSHAGNLSQVRVNLHRSWLTDQCYWHRLMIHWDLPKVHNLNV